MNETQKNNNQKCGYILKLIISNNINDIRAHLKSDIYKIVPKLNCCISNTNDSNTNDSKTFELTRKFFIDNGLPSKYTIRLSRTHVKIVQIKDNNNNNNNNSTHNKYSFWLEDTSSNGIKINKQQCIKGKLTKLNENDIITLLGSSPKLQDLELSYKFKHISQKKQSYYSQQQLENKTTAKRLKLYNNYNESFFGISILIAAPLVYRTIETNKLIPLTTINYIRERRAICNAVDQAYRTRCELNQPTMIPLKIYHRIATISTLRQVLIEEKSKILHFSGHGEENILSLEDGYGGLYPLHYSMLTQLLKQITPRNLELVVLGACNSESIGQIFINSGVNYVIAIANGKTIREESIYLFFEVFYHSLAIGKSIKNAFNLAKTSLTDSIRLRQIGVLDLEKESNKFLLLYNPNVSTKEILFPTPQIVASVTIPKPFVSALKMLDEKSDELALPPAPLNLRGRNIEMFELINLVLKCKWTNIHGDTGIGKTGFTLTIAHYIQERQIFENGVIFIEANTIDVNTCLIHYNRIYQQINQCKHCILSNIANRLGCSCWKIKRTNISINNNNNHQINRSLSCPTTTNEVAVSDFRLKQSGDSTCLCSARKKHCLLFIDDCDAWFKNLNWSDNLFKLFPRLSIVTVSKQNAIQNTSLLKITPINFELKPLQAEEMVNILLKISPRTLTWEDCNNTLDEKELEKNSNLDRSTFLQILSRMSQIQSLKGNLYKLSVLASHLGQKLIKDL